MFLDKMFNEGSTPVLERMLQFTAARQKLIAENVVNISLPNYRQKDLSLEQFQAMLRDRIDDRDSSRSARFDDITAELEQPEHGILFHDGTNRSMEQLMTDQAKNGMMHNFIIELLR